VETKGDMKRKPCTCKRSRRNTFSIKYIDAVT